MPAPSCSVEWPPGSLRSRSSTSLSRLPGPFILGLRTPISVLLPLDLGASECSICAIARVSFQFVSGEFFFFLTERYGTCMVYVIVLFCSICRVAMVIFMGFCCFWV